MRAPGYTPSNLLWGDFVTMVTQLTGLEGQRVGSGVENLRLLYIRQAVMQLQGAIDQYRVNHETVYQPQDFVTEGAASRFVKPPQSVIRNVFLYKTCTDARTGDAQAVRWDTDPWPWSDRFALVKGTVAVNNNRGRICIDPQGYTGYVYPEVFDCWLMSIHWDGLKLEFQDQDETPFDEATAGAVALFVKAHMKTEVQDREGLPMFQELMKEFRLQFPILNVREREKMQGKG